MKKEIKVGDLVRFSIPHNKILEREFLSYRLETNHRFTDTLGDTFVEAEQMVFKLLDIEIYRASPGTRSYLLEAYKVDGEVIDWSGGAPRMWVDSAYIFPIAKVVPKKSDIFLTAIQKIYGK